MCSHTHPNRVKQSRHQLAILWTIFLSNLVMSILLLRLSTGDLLDGNDQRPKSGKILAALLTSVCAAVCAVFLFRQKQFRFGMRRMLACLTYVVLLLAFPLATFGFSILLIPFVFVYYLSLPTDVRSELDDEPES